MSNRKTKRKSKSKRINGKSKPFRPIAKICKIADKITGKLGNCVIGSANRVTKTVRKIDKTANKLGNAIERLHKAQTKAGL